MTVFIRALDTSHKADLLRQAAKGGTISTFSVSVEDFRQVPGCPFAYWTSPQIRKLFVSLPDMTGMEAQTKCGLGTLDDFRFLRLSWEIKFNAKRWPTFAKGGTFSRFYSDLLLCLSWETDGLELKLFVEAKVGSVSRKIQAQDFYFRRGLTWPRRTQSGLGLRVMPAACIFADKGPAVFVDGDSGGKLLQLLSITTSAAFRYLVELQMAFGSYEVGVIQRTPIPNLPDAEQSALATLARRAWSLKRTLDTVHETSHAFLLPTALRPRATAYDPPAIERDLAAIQREIDDIAFRLYGLEGSDRAEIEAWAQKGKSAAPEAESLEGESAVDEDPEPADEDLESAADDRGTLLSWCIGVAFGRFDIRLATHQREAPPEPEPFDALPARSPGMLPEGDAPFRSTTGILVDDPGHADDLTAAAKAVLERVALPAPEDLRPWLAREFFPLHLQMYSKSRRKAPIYWQLATPSASYSVWLYLHAFSKDTLYKVQNDYATAKLHHEERKLETMRADYGPSPTAAGRKALAPQEAFVEELRTFLEEVKRVAPLWNPDLDDGVIINFAPLWRLVPQHRPWQKELKATWDALCAGDYDWAHLAMHLWPERVVPKCAGDRSLAIAHGLEETFWAEDAAGKWKRRPEPTRPLEALVKERTSTAVKAALHALLEAPTPGGAAAKKTPRAGRGKGTSSRA